MSSKCTDKKNKECKEKGKICNPITGRCIKNSKKPNQKNHANVINLFKIIY